MSILPEVLTKDTVPKLLDDGVFSFENGASIELDLSQVKLIDTAGIAYLYWLKQQIERKAGRCHWIALQKETEARLEAYARAVAQTTPTLERSVSLTGISLLGYQVVSIAKRQMNALIYVGEVLYHTGVLLLKPHHFRWQDCRIAFYRCGVQAVPVVMLMGFLLGLILAFQSAIPLKMFGGQGFVGGLVGIALVRELGLIITAILVTGRSGSSFAAELGTMQINEEIDALCTMGLYPVRFLVLPRIIAGTFALPILALFATFAGLLGGWLVMLLLGFSTNYYITQLQTFVHLKDLIGSFAKSFIFGWVIAAVGCYFGLHAGRDAGAVGTSTTTAVVTGIMLIVVLEGIFSVVFYAMGW